MYLNNCYFIDVNGIIDIYLNNSDRIFVPINYSYISNFFFEENLTNSNIIDQLYYSQRKILYG